MKKLISTQFSLHIILISLIIVFFLAISAFLLINPEKLMRIQRNEQRVEDLKSIEASINEYKAEMGSDYIEIAEINIGSTHVIGTCTKKGETGCGDKITHEKCVDLSGLMSPVPKDPFSGTDLKTDYFLRKNEDGGLFLGACDPEPEEIF